LQQASEIIHGMSPLLVLILRYLNKEKFMPKAKKAKVKTVKVTIDKKAGDSIFYLGRKFTKVEGQFVCEMEIGEAQAWAKAGKLTILEKKEDGTN